MTNFQYTIKKIRKEHHMTQFDLGKQLGVSAQTVSRWENGVHVPTQKMQYEICKQFNISSDEVVDLPDYEDDTESAVNRQYNRMPIGLNVLFSSVHDYDSFALFIDAVWHSYFLLSEYSDEKSNFAIFSLNSDGNDDIVLSIDYFDYFDNEKLCFSIEDYTLTLYADKIKSIRKDVTFNNLLYSFIVEYDSNKNLSELQLIFASR